MMSALPTGIRKHSSRGGYEIRMRFKDPQSGESKRASAYAKTLVEAKKKLRDMQNRLDGSQSPVDRSVSLGDWARYWQTELLPVSGLKPNTIDLYRGLVSTHLMDSALAGQKMSDIRPVHLSRFMYELAASKGQSLQRNLFVVLKHLFRSAQQNGIVSSTPLAAIAPPKRAKQKVRFITDQELEKLLHRLLDSRYLPVVGLVLQTGLRRGEALGLAWDDVDLEKKALHVRFTLDAKGRRGEPKTSRSVRIIDLNSKALNLLRELRVKQNQDRLRLGQLYNSDSWNPVFRGSSGRAMSAREFLRAVQRAAKAAGLEADASKEPVGIHTLRHYVASKLLESGVEMYVVSRILGHESIKTTVDIYGHLQDSQRKSALELLA
jgi:integrase